MCQESLVPLLRYILDDVRDEGDVEVCTPIRDSIRRPPINYP
jgi:hypothetical protein